MPGLDCMRHIGGPALRDSYLDGLSVAKKFIVDLAADARMLPEVLEPWRIKQDYTFIYGTDLCKAESEDEHDDDLLSDLEEVRSNHRPEVGAERRTMRGIIYDMAHTPARHLRLEAPDGANMDLSEFDTALCDARRPYSLFSVFTQHYEPYSGSIDLNGRGDILIYRAFGIHASECPQIECWQREALSSKEQEDTTMALLSEAQSVALLSTEFPMFKIVRPEVKQSRTSAVASSSKTHAANIEDRPEMSPMMMGVRSSSSKHKAADEARSDRKCARKGGNSAEDD
ncbi:hypothetical protein K438DRAFT_1784192 [Mycena galopus ATCC 62051]|nr:hypothetical protein K438DRAFT_1784192 [Mycena galopus ATCC 62051]